MRVSMQSWQTRLWTAVPGVIKQFPAASGLGQMIADVQPVINARVRDKSGNFLSMQMPVLLDCPIQWQGGGGVTLTFPIVAGDECLVVFSARCIDAWFQQGFVPGQAGQAVNGHQPMDPPDLRMHNLSDGFALVGVRSLPREYEVSPTNAELRSDDGQMYIALNPSNHSMQLIAPGSINLNGIIIDSSGNLTSDGIIKGHDVQNSVGTSLTTHTHTIGGPIPIPGS